MINEEPSVKVVLKAKIIQLEMFEKSLEEKMNDANGALHRTVLRIIH